MGSGFGSGLFGPGAAGGLGYGGYRQTSAQIYGGSAPWANQSAGAGTFQNCTFQNAPATVQAFQQAQQALVAALADPRYTEQTIEDAGVKVGEVIGWRVWRIENGWLYSAVMSNVEWEPGKVMEAHKVGPIVGDGIHAFKTRKQAIAYSAPDCVVGRVALWGQIYEFEQGWHGEFAKIHSLDWINKDRLVQADPLLPKPMFRLWSRRQDKKVPRLTLLDQLRQTYGLVEADDTIS